MDTLLYGTPYFTESARRFLGAVAALPVRVAVISQEAQEGLPLELRSRFAGHWRVADALDADQVTEAARQLISRHGQPSGFIVASEQMQEAVAATRERLGIPGMNLTTTRNFRDKARMKFLFREAGVPCARYRCVTSDAEAIAFGQEVGFPLVLKPLAGAASQATYRIEDLEALRQAMRASAPSATNPLQLEEFVVGQEHSLETFSVDGVPQWHSLTCYLPTPLETMRNPWIQWRVVLPREADEAAFDDIRAVGAAALKSLGMGTGLTHLEWFRRNDGSLAVSEVAARPPGAQIVTLISRAHDIDAHDLWARLMAFGTFTPPPPRRYAAGAAYLRGLGAGRVRGTTGLAEVLRDLGNLVTDVSAPRIGQEKALSYEGEGFVIVRHPETRVVEQALLEIVNRVRVELVAS